MLSFWENKLNLKADFIVVGAGIMGCSVAFELREKYKHAKIVILERGILPTGASTKNAGFACFGSVTEILSDIKKMGLQDALQLVKDRRAGLSILSSRLSDQQMGLTRCGGYELILQDVVSADEIFGLNKELLDSFHEEVFEDISTEIKSFGFSSDVRQLIRCKQEAQIDSGNTLMHYWNLLHEKNITIITGAEVEYIDGNKLFLKDGIKFSADKIIFCTNAFTKCLQLKNEIKPGRGQVIVTNEIENLKIKGSFHFDEGFYYFRNIGKRILFGGGRNLDFQKEETTAFETNEIIVNDLLQKLKKLIIPNTHFEIEAHWQGIMAFSENKLPSIQAINSYADYVMACNGMGVALSPLVAKQVVSVL